MDNIEQLTLEQQYKLKSFSFEIEKLSEKEAKQRLFEVLRLMMVKDNLIKQMFKESGEI